MKIKKLFLITFLMISLTPMIIIELNDIHQTNLLLLSNSFSQLESITEIEEQRIEDNVDSHFKILSIIKADSNLRSTLYDFNKSGDEKIFQTSLNTILSDFRELNDYIIRISIFGFDGNIIASSDVSSIGTKFPEIRDLKINSDVNQHFTISSNDQGILESKFIDVITFENKHLGFITIDLKSSDIFTTVNYPSLGETGQILLLNKNIDGDFKIYDIQKFQDGIVKTVKSEDIPNTPTVKSFSVGINTHVKNDFDDKALFFSTHIFDDYRWGLVTTIQKTESFQLIDELILASTVTIILIGVIISLVAIFFSKFFSKPIESLNVEMLKAKEGKLDLKITHSHSDEINSLNLSLESMLVTLNEKSQLEKKILISEEKRKQSVQIQKLTEGHIGELKLIDKQKDEFISMMSHELKTPLTVIEGYCEMLLNPIAEFELDQNSPDFIKTINTNAKKLEILINDLLDAQRLELGRMKFNKKEFNIKNWLNIIHRDYSILSKNNGITFVNSNTLDVDIFSDPDRLEQVMRNLIVNAMAFLPSKNGIIEIGTINKKDKITFFVKDNGTGISKKNQSHIFKKFYQADTSESRKHPGTGLGLAVCEGIVEKLHGHMSLDSIPGKGSIFSLSIPKTHVIKNVKNKERDGNT